MTERHSLEEVMEFSLTSSLTTPLDNKDLDRPGGMGWQDPYDIWYEQIQSPASEKEGPDPLAMTRAEDWLSGEQLCSKRNGGLQAGSKLNMNQVCPGSKGGQQHPRLH